MKAIPSEGDGSIVKQAVYLCGFIGRFGTHTQRYVFTHCIGSFGRYGFLGGKDALEFRPIMSDTLQFKLIADYGCPLKKWCGFIFHCKSVNNDTFME